MSTKPDFPKKIICLTEESVETLALLGEDWRITGHSAYVKRPTKILERNLPIVSAFAGANIEKIVKSDPDLVLGFSDIQQDIARKLIARGLSVYIANHRSIKGILDYVLTLSGVVGVPDEGQKLVDKIIDHLDEIRRKAREYPSRPRIYFEEWDEPRITGIQWVSEIIELAGGDPIFSDKARGPLAKDRFVQDSEVIGKDPEIIFGCWCGKPFSLPDFLERVGYDEISGVKNNQIHEVPAEIFLQPGPAALLEGPGIVQKYIEQYL